MNKRNENRERMPQIAEFYDQVVSVFGEAKVMYAKENGYEVGKKNLT